MKKSLLEKKPKLTSEQRKLRAESDAIEREFNDKQKLLNEKQTALQAEAKELEAIRRRQIMLVLKGFGVSEEEANVLNAAFTALPGALEIGKTILAEGEKAKLPNLNNFAAKLVRLGLL